jgi:HEAT repeat protein
MMQNATKPARLVPPPEFQAAEIDKLDAAALAAMLKNSSSSVFQKAKACQRLAQVGSGAEVPAIATLLPDEQLSHYARFALEAIPGPESEDALRAAVAKTKGGTLVGVITSIAFRRDAKATAKMASLMGDKDPAVAEVAAYALGRIGTAEAATALTAALPKAKDRMRAAVADACLQCAEGMLAAGHRDEALALYSKVTGADIPKPQRLAAMHGIIRAEGSLSRPR